MSKQCTKCFSEKPADKFYILDCKKSSWCKECFSKYRKRQYKKNLEKEKIYAKIYRKTNKEYYEAYNKRYVQLHREEIRKNAILGRQNELKKYKQTQKKYSVNNISKYLLWKAKSRAKKNGIVFSITEKDFTVDAYCPVLGNKMNLLLLPGDRWNSPTLDRYDNNKGYISGNVRVISYKANSIKSNGSLEEFKAIHLFLQKKVPLNVKYLDEKKYKLKARDLLSKAKYNAKKRNIFYSLSKKDKEEMYKKIPMFCPMLGIKISISNSKRKNNSLSIDRIDNKKGYVVNNLLFCSWRANDLKANAAIDEIEKIVFYLKNFCC